MSELISWIEEHPEIKTLPVELRPAYYTTGWLPNEGQVFRVDTNGNVSRINWKDSTMPFICGNCGHKRDIHGPEGCTFIYHQPQVLNPNMCICTITPEEIVDEV